MTEPSRVRFVRGLVSELLFLRDLVDERVEAYGEILAHLFFAELTERVIGLCERVQQGDPEARTPLQRVLHSLESGFASEEKEVQELISDSFLEHLPWKEEDRGWGLRKYLGPNLTRRLSEVG